MSFLFVFSFLMNMFIRASLCNCSQKLIALIDFFSNGLMKNCCIVSQLYTFLLFVGSRCACAANANNLYIAVKRPSVRLSVALVCPRLVPGLSRFHISAIVDLTNRRTVDDHPFVITFGKCRFATWPSNYRSAVEASCFMH